MTGHASTTNRSSGFAEIAASLYAILLVILAGTNASATVYRMMTGDYTTINNDWSANEGGYTFDPVEDGSPATPVISAEHFAGKYSIGIQVPTDNSGNKERFEYKIAKAADADGLHFDNARYCGFAFKLAAPTASFGSSTLIWQAWQGSPWGPPASLKFGSGSSAPYRIRLTIRNTSTFPRTPGTRLSSTSHPATTAVETSNCGSTAPTTWIGRVRSGTTPPSFPTHPTAWISRTVSINRMPTMGTQSISTS